MQVSSHRQNPAIVGTASADGVARLWDVLSGACVSTYTGHRGSVNSIRLHGSQACTASGDGTVHLWTSPSLTAPDASTQLSLMGRARAGSASDVTSLETSSSRRAADTEAAPRTSHLATFEGHTAPVVAAEWFSDGYLRV